MRPRPRLSKVVSSKNKRMKKCLIPIIASICFSTIYCADAFQSVIEAENSANTLRGTAQVSSNSCASGGQVVGWIGDGGQNDNSTLQDNANILRQAINNASPGDILSLPPGTFKFYRSGNATIEIKNKSDLTIVGQGDGSGSGLTELVFHYGTQDHQAVFRVENSQRIWLKDFAIDWAWEIDPLAYYAEVTQKGSNHINVRFPDPITPGEVDWNNVEQISPAPGFGPAANGVEVWGVNPTSVTQVWPRVLRVEGASGLKNFSVGDWVRIRQHDHEGNHVWVLMDAGHIVFEHITIYSGTLMGWNIRGESNSIKLDYARIVPKPGRPLSTYADGLRIGQFTGNLEVQNCEFSHQGDDALNIKQNVSVGARRDTLVFASDLPSFSGTDFTLINERYVVGNYIIADNYFHSSRARGILPKLPNGTVTGNLVENTMGPAVFFSLGVWNGTDGEGAYVEDVDISSNTSNQRRFRSHSTLARVVSVPWVDTKIL